MEETIGDMDPIHLNSEELDYELMIRKVYEMNAPQRIKTGKLRELLAKENIDASARPGRGVSPFAPAQDLEMCGKICQEIKDAVQNDSLSIPEKQVILSRAIHLGFRLQRIDINEPALIGQLQEYKNMSRVALRKLSQNLTERESGAPSNQRTGRASVSFTVPVADNVSEFENISGNSTRHSFPLAPTTNANRFTATSSAQPPPLRGTGAIPRVPIPPEQNIRQMTPVINLRNVRLRDDERENLTRQGAASLAAQAHEPQVAVPGQNESNIVLGQEGTVEDQRRGLSATEISNGFPTFHQTQPNNIRSQFNGLNISDQSQLTENWSNDAPSGIGSQFISHRRGGEAAAQRLPVRQNTLDFYQGGENEANRESIAQNTQNELAMYQDTNMNSTFSSANTSNRALTDAIIAQLAANAGALPTENTYNIQNRTYAIMPGQPTVVPQHFFPAAISMAQPSAHALQPNNWPPVPPSAQAQSSARQPTTNPPPNHFDFGRGTQPTSVPNTVPIYLNGVYYDVPINNIVNARSTQVAQSDERKIPVNHWKIVFSGEETKSSKNDLGIHDFLAQVEMLMQAERMSEQQLLKKIPHLLIGNARTWYTLHHHRIFTWNDFITQIKQRFLSTDYNYLLYSEVQNRKQGKNEPIGNYVAEMQAKFRAMSNPPDEHHRLYIVRNNMLYEHAMALATANIQSVEQLEMLVKQRESAKASQLAYKRQLGLLRPAVNELVVDEANTDSSHSENESESANDVSVVETKDKFRAKPRFEKKFTSNNKPQQSRVTRKSVTCFNCRKQGHVFNDCSEPVTRIFCFRCGKDDNVSPTCTNCFPTKNEAAVLLTSEQAADDNQSEN